MQVIERKKPASIEEAIRRCLESEKAFHRKQWNKPTRSNPHPSNVFHTEAKCKKGNNIEVEDIVCGEGTKRDECEECEGIREKRKKKKWARESGGLQY